MGLETNNTSKYLLRYNLVLCTIGGCRVINDAISTRLKEMFLNVLVGYGITLEGWEFQPNYIWVTFRAEPRTEMSKFINSYKTSSSRRIKNEFECVRDALTDKTFWSRGYCLVTGCGADKPTIFEYIRSMIGGGSAL